jgi:hypothetical protein
MMRRRMKTESLAIVTSGTERDLDLCATLNRSVLEFLPNTVRHYIIVDKYDLRTFFSLNGRRTVVIASEDVLPTGFAHTLRLNRWLAPGTLLPLRASLVRQIARISTASLLLESTLVLVDPDTVFVRDVDLDVFSRDGQTRLYVRRNGVTAGMPAHLTWHRNACSLLDVPSSPAPVDDYTGNVISWGRRLVLQMREHVEHVAGRPWYDAIARAGEFSDSMLYGLYLERIAGLAGKAWIDGHARCNTHHAASALSTADVAAVVEGLRAEDLAMTIGADSSTTAETRAAAIRLATNGRL